MTPENASAHAAPSTYIELLGLARDLYEIAESANACPEWLRWARTEKTDDVMDLAKAVIAKAEGRTESAR